jgi:2'-hydroxyisoflavone reductase
MTSRRDFVKVSSAALAAASFPGLLPAQPAAPLRILILGGTGYIGPHLVRHAVSRGHHITTFTRGRRNPELPEGIERLIGDRNGQLDALKGKKWDAVIDDSATNPDWVRQSTELLKDSVGRYLFTSSTGVYYPYLKRGYDESDAPHLDLKDEKDGSEVFGVNKAKCEQQVRDIFRERYSVVRPSYIVGPGDTSDRFPYWPVRLKQGGEVFAPGKKDDPVAFIDVRDLAEFMVKVIEENRQGTYNIVGPRTPMTSREFYERAKAAINPAVKYVYVEDYDFIEKHKIDSSVPWILLKGNDYGHQSIKNEKAVAAGLKFKPVEETLRDTLAWWPSVPEARRNAPRWAISAATEAQALADWKARG